MKKLLLIVLAIILTASTAIAGGGGHGGRGGRGGNTYNYYVRGGCGRGYNSNAFWGSFSGAAAGALLMGALASQQQTVIVQEVVPAASVVYARPTFIIICPACRSRIDCSNIPQNYRFACPICGSIIN